MKSAQNHSYKNILKLKQLLIYFAEMILWGFYSYQLINCPFLIKICAVRAIICFEQFTVLKAKIPFNFSCLCIHSGKNPNFDKTKEEEEEKSNAYIWIEAFIWTKVK